MSCLCIFFPWSSSWLDSNGHCAPLWDGPANLRRNKDMLAMTRHPFNFLTSRRHINITYTWWWSPQRTPCCPASERSVFEASRVWSQSSPPSPHKTLHAVWRKWRPPWQQGPWGIAGTQSTPQMHCSWAWKTQESQVVVIRRCIVGVCAVMTIYLPALTFAWIKVGKFYFYSLG